MQRKGRGWPTLIATTLIAIILCLPLLGALYTALRSDAAIASGPFTFGWDTGLTHFKNAMGAAGYNFAAYFRNSIVIASGAVVLTALIAVPASYAIVRLGFGGPWLLRIAATLRVLPAIFFAIPFYKLFMDAGLIDTTTSLILTNTFLNVPLALLVLANGVREIPREIDEAAAIDGCGPYRTLALVLLPLLAPSMVAIAVLTFLFSWADYLFAVILSASEATPVTVGAANFVTSYGVRWGDISAATVLSVLPPLVFAMLAQKFLVRGLAAGAVKG